ncbi:endoglucanase A-like [Saccoglossus kowalevskii]|uniref:Endoglucanase n=1 Tax=Saccoglossus kowalevskii TaxID=10224 RepID=A0ABM0MW45_SACKO|nr:PREDICTED: endoglucanase 13-like [Saccoglossus kowalevskii]
MGRQHKYIIADPKPPTDSTDVDLKLKDVEEGEVEKKRYMCGGFFGFSCLAIVAFIIGAILVAGISAIATLGALGYLDMMKGTIRPKPTYTTKTETPTVTSVYNVTTQSPNVTITTTELPTKTELTTELPVITSSLSPVTTSHSTTPKITTAIPSLGYNYSEVLHKSILFYEAERSGELPPDNRIPYRRDSAMEDQGLNGEDLTGGWYDAGDHLKSTFSTAYAVSTLTWGFLAFPDGYREAGEYDRFLDSIKWPLDWLLKAHTIPGEELYVQVGLPSADHRYWGRPEEMTMDRPAYKIDAENPGSDVAGQTAAAMAAGYLAFRDSDPDYADTLLNNSRLLYTFASTYRGRYSDVLDTVIYTSGAYGDELAWAAVWLHLATGEQSYLDDAMEFYEEFELWKNPRHLLLLYNITNDGQYSSKFKKCMNMWLPGGGINRVFNGQLAVYLDWGSLRYTSTMAFLALVAADIGIRPTAYRDFAISQINFMLGDGGRSYVVGFGENPPQRVHHRAASCPDMPTSCRWNYFGSSEPNPQILYGALAGGPNKAGVYQDSRSSYETNEVAIDYNAGFQSAIAGMLNLQVIGVDTST